MVNRPAWVSLGLTLLVGASCTRREPEKESPKPAPSISTAAAPQTKPTLAPRDEKPATKGAPQPDFLKYPPITMKPACASAMETAPNEGGNHCVKMTLHCPELDPGEDVWLATSPAVAKVKLPEGSAGLRIAEEDQIAATVCCKPSSEGAKPVTAQIRLFTNEVAGANHTIACR